MRYKTKSKILEEMGWHKYFAWFPVSIKGEIFWLEYVERNYVGWFFFRFFQYREIKEIK